MNCKINYFVNRKSDILHYPQPHQSSLQPSPASTANITIAVVLAETPFTATHVVPLAFRRHPAALAQEFPAAYSVVVLEVAPAQAVGAPEIPAAAMATAAVVPTEGVVATRRLAAAARRRLAAAVADRPRSAGRRRLAGGTRCCSC